VEDAVADDRRKIRNDNITVPTGRAVTEFLDGVSDPAIRADAEVLVALAAEVTGEPPVMWGSSIIGFGSRHYRYDSGREGDVAAVSFAPRKSALTLYLTGGVESYADLLADLGQHRTGKGCLYLPRLADVDLVVVRRIVERCYRYAADGDG
jgi:hypothetical protein